MNMWFSAIIFVVVAIGCMPDAVAQQQNTMQRKLQRVTSVSGEQAIKARRDTVMMPDSAMVRLAGFDKTIGATSEAFFVKNGMDGNICSLRVRISYFDMQGRQLHEVVHTVSADIPAGQTRQVAVPTWDKQHSFYYCRSVRPRRQATPFDVKCRVESVVVSSGQ